MIGLRTKDAVPRQILRHPPEAERRRRRAAVAFIIQTQDWGRWRRRSGSARSPTSSSPPPRPSSRSPSARRASARRPHPRPAQARRRRRRRGAMLRRPQVAERVHGGGVGRVDPLSSRRTDPRPVERRGRPRAVGARLRARWSQLKENEQEALVKPVVVLLSKDFHTKQSSLSPNVVHGWLQALAACEPAPKLPAALLKYLTKTFNAWHLCRAHARGAHPPPPRRGPGL